MIKRFLYSAGANLIRSLLSFITGIMLARWLGPAEFGNMAFLLGTFLGLRQLFDLGSSSAFFTFLSQHTRSWTFVRRYIYWLALQLAIPVLLIISVFPFRVNVDIWQNFDTLLVVLAFAASFSQGTLWSVAQQLAEANRKTAFVQRLGILAALFHVIAIFMFAKIGVTGLYPIFIAIVLEYLVVFYIVILNLYRDSIHRLAADQISLEPKLRDYWDYCIPLLPLFILGAIQELVDRWSLQHFGGAVDQGHYAFGYQLAGVAALFVTALVRVLWKEVAEAYHQNNINQMIELFSRVLRFMRYIAGTVVGFVAVFADRLIDILGGSRYGEAAMTMSILSIYIGYMTISQLYSMLLMATGKVKTIGCLGTITSLGSIILTYTFYEFIPYEFQGALGAAGVLAVKMVVVEVIATTLFSFMLYRIWKVNLKTWMQVWCILLGVAAAFISKKIGLVFIAEGQSIILLATGAFLYLSLMTILLLFAPWIFGLKKVEIMELISVVGPKK